MTDWLVGLKSNRVLLVALAALLFGACGPGAVPPRVQVPPSARAPDRVDGRRLAAAGFAVPPALLSADLYQLRHIAVVATSDHDAWSDPPESLYDAILGFRLDTSADDGQRESARFADGLALLSGLPAEKSVWTEGLAGLLARRAIETVPGAPVRTAVFIDTPHRGVSPAGWPNWPETAGRVPGFAVTGSAFLHLLNAPATGPPVRYINVWRLKSGASPRASVMQLPRAFLGFVAVPAGSSPWSLLDSQPSALRLVDDGGPSPRPRETIPRSADQNIGEYGPIPVDGSGPSLRTVLADPAAVPVDARKAWIQYAGAGQLDPADPLSGITDAIAIQILPPQNAVRIIGFEDYFREPLRSEYFYSALNAYAAGSAPAISIDPRKQTDPPGMLPVRYEGLTAGSRLGGVLFEADRVMKTLAMATDNITGTQVDSGAPGHAPVVGGTASTAGGGDGSLWRLWFEPDRWHARNAGDWTAIVDARMSVKWELMSGSSPSAAVARFADNLTNQFFTYAQEHPAFDQLDQVSAEVAIGRFAWESGVISPGSVGMGVRTPSFTPLRRVELTRNVDLWRITQIFEGGATEGQQLRSVPDIGGRNKTNLDFAQLERPPTSIGNVLNVIYKDRVAKAAVIAANTRGAHLIPNARDAIDSPPYPPNSIMIERTRRFIPPQIADISIDDSRTPPVVQVNGSGFGSQSGTAEFNGVPVAVVLWGDRGIAVALPQFAKGLLHIAAPDGFSLDINIDFEVYRPPPGFTVVNDTGSAITVNLAPQGSGAPARLDIGPHGRATTLVLPGVYSVETVSSGNMLVDASNRRTSSFERGQAYTLRIDETILSIGHLAVVNQTGAGIQVSAGSRQLTVPSGGRTQIDLPAGVHSVTFSTRCGTQTRPISITPGGTEEVTYQCVRQ